MAAAYKLPGVAAILLDDFSGGLNYRDAPSELDPNETNGCRNVLFDERGGVVARLGFAALNAGSLLPQPPSFLYSSDVAGAILAYISTDAGNGKLYKSTDAGVTWSSVYTTFTAGALGAIVDFAGKVVVVNTLDGVYVFPAGLGAPTHTAGGTNNMDEVRGSALTVWQNHVLVTGDPREDATHSRARVWKSKAGDATTWTIATDYNDLREVDNTPCMAIGAGQGMDVTAKPTLLVAKNRGLYRINDSTSLAYTTMDRQAGCSSAQALATSLGRICMLNDLGMWVTDGVSQIERVSDNISPLFTKDGLNLGAMGKVTAGVHGDQIVFAVPRAGSSVPNLSIEYHPIVGWITHHNFAPGPMALYQAGSVRKLVGGATGSGKVFECFKGGTDDGQPFTAWWQTKPIRLNNGVDAGLLRLRAWGRGTVKGYLKMNYTEARGDELDLDFAGAAGGGRWGSGKWGTFRWGSSIYERTVELPLSQVGTHATLRIEATVSTSAFAPKLLEDGAQPEIGSWALYNLKLDTVPLGSAYVVPLGQG